MQPNIFWASVITTAVSILLWGSYVFLRKKNKRASWLWILFLLELPASYLALEYVRLPLDSWIRSFIDTKNLYIFITLWYAPVTEELVKLWPLLIPFLLAKIKPEYAVRAGMALGLGFGVGEIWMLAHKLSGTPAIAGYEWWQLNGFIGERLIVTLIHAGMTAWAVVWITRKRPFKGIAGAMVMHFFLNLPILFIHIDLFGLGKTFWSTAVALWVQFYALFMFILLSYLAFGKVKPGKFLFGEATCPHCHKTYDRPLFGFNLIHKRYERCRYCRKFFWSSLTGKRK